MSKIIEKVKFDEILMSLFSDYKTLIFLKSENDKIKNVLKSIEKCFQYFENVIQSIKKRFQYNENLLLNKLSKKEKLVEKKARKPLTAEQKAKNNEKAKLRRIARNEQKKIWDQEAAKATQGWYDKSTVKK